MSRRLVVLEVPTKQQIHPHRRTRFVGREIGQSAFFSEFKLICDVLGHAVAEQNDFRVSRLERKRSDQPIEG